MGRLTNNDRRFGPITYARSSWNPVRLVLSSGDREDESNPPNTLTAYAFGWVARINVPRIIKPHAVRHSAKSWDAATVARMGRDWYEETFPKEYGFCLNEGSLRFYYGPQTHDSRTTKSRGWFLPWMQLRHVRWSFYDTNGALFWEQLNRDDIRGGKSFDERYKAKKLCPTVAFSIRDHDGELMVATTRIEEMEWRLGTGLFKWLAWFSKPRIRRSLNIEFSAETGTEKGSWKGGTTGTSIDMLPGELHESAIQRYCEQEHRSKYGNYRVELVRPLP